MLKAAGKLLIVFGLAALVSMAVFEGVSRRRVPYYYIGRRGWGGSAWVDLGNKSAFIITSSWFNPPVVEGVSYELECRASIWLGRFKPSPPLPNASIPGVLTNITIYEMKLYVINKSAAGAGGFIWGMLLSSKLPDALKVLEEYSEVSVNLEEESQLITPKPPFRSYRAKAPLRRSNEERMAIFIMLSNATSGSREPDIDLELLMKIEPSLQQYARGIYLLLAGISLVVLHYLRNPQEAEDLLRRIRRKFLLLSGKSARESSS